MAKKNFKWVYDPSKENYVKVPIPPKPEQSSQTSSGNSGGSAFAGLGIILLAFGFFAAILSKFGGGPLWRPNANKAMEPYFDYISEHKAEQCKDLLAPLHNEELNELSTHAIINGNAAWFDADKEYWYGINKKISQYQHPNLDRNLQIWAFEKSLVDLHKGEPVHNLSEGKVEAEPSFNWAAQSKQGKDNTIIPDQQILDTCKWLYDNRANKHQLSYYLSTLTHDNIAQLYNYAAHEELAALSYYEATVQNIGPKDERFVGESFQWSTVVSILQPGMDRQTDKEPKASGLNNSFINRALDKLHRMSNGVLDKF